jgi:hypothetical protein
MAQRRKTEIRTDLFSVRDLRSRAQGDLPALTIKRMRAFSAATGRFCDRTYSPFWRARTAHCQCGIAQPAVCRVGVQAGMPHRRYHYLRSRDGKVEASEALPD